MAQVAVVTDGGAAMPPELVEEYDIAVVPFQLMWEGETLRDGIDITPTQFYRRLRTAKSLPTTSQPLAGDFVIDHHFAQGLFCAPHAERLEAISWPPLPQD